MKNLLKLMDLSDKEIQIVLYLLPDKRLSSSELEKKLSMRQPSMNFYLKSLYKKHVIQKVYSKSSRGRQKMTVFVSPSFIQKMAGNAQKYCMEFEADLGKLL